MDASIIKDEILNLAYEGATIIFSTHRMESVEELCEYITLLNESEKILDGKLSDIKKAYKNNTYQVGVRLNVGQEQALVRLQDQLKVSNSAYDQEENLLDFTLNLPSPDTQQALEVINGLGMLSHFEETIPSANDIFIRTVEEKQQHG